MGLPNADPFLLVAHHKHWFDPRDPLRGPFRAFGKATGLPYIDVEGFSMHPHRGFDILTYILDGSDGFRLCGNQKCRVHGDDAALLGRSSGEEPASPRHRAGGASMAWRTTR